MTNEEIQKIAQSRVSAIGPTELLTYIQTELQRRGFRNLRFSYDIDKCVVTINETIEILPFDFIKGAGAVVLLPGDEREWLKKDNIRVWMAEYIAGYSAFWNLEGSGWLREALSDIRDGKESDEARKTVAHLCARIAANIAVDRKFKHFPRFYLMKS